MKRLDEMYAELEEMRDREAIKLFRLSRKAAERGCSLALCVRIREEGWCVQRIQPEQLLNPFLKWEFAFKFGGNGDE